MVLAFFIYLQLQIKKIMLQTLTHSLFLSANVFFFWSSCVTTGPKLNTIYGTHVVRKPIYVSRHIFFVLP